MSTYDILVNCLPFGLFMSALFILQLIFTLLCPVFGISLKDAFLGANYDGFNIMNFINARGYLFNLVKSCVTGYVVTVLSAVIVFIVAGKRVKNVSFMRKVWLSLIWPFFLVIQFPMDVQALFSKNLGWKVIPHSDGTRIHNLK